MNETRVIVVDRIGPDVLVKEEGAAKEKVAIDERAEQEQTHARQGDGEEETPILHRDEVGGNNRPRPRILAQRNSSAVRIQPKP